MAQDERDATIEALRRRVALLDAHVMSLGAALSEAARAHDEMLAEVSRLKETGK